MNTSELNNRIRLQDLENIATGAGFLGCGGGGDPYIGHLIAKAAIEECGEPELISPDDFDDDELVVGCAFIGAPSVMQEKCISGEDAILAIRMVEEKLGRKVSGIISGEIGGLNGMLPIGTAARMGLPVVDADGVGRAVPGIDMTAWNSAVLKTGPIALVSEHLDSVVIDSDSPHRAEDIARNAVAAMGLSVMSALYAMPGRDMKRASIPYTMSIARGIGQAVRANHKNPVEDLLDYLRQTVHYSKCGVLASGKVTHLHREVKHAWVVGDVKVQCESGDIAEINFQNEYLKLEKGGKLLATVPDLISVIDTETGAPIAAEALRFGQRVTIIGTSSPNRLRTEQAVSNCGPKRFGIGEHYLPIESINNFTIE
ncbi:DUF917 domain-containing protein [Pseudomaricurvus alkylphenolicus]|uniref:DUF917 domain-containing protein n=1 Tax=Pseudomaricurvus alkylphenolicus TaxID=1306991 RepID=UPI0014249836|nr:DUF917 domain-containing protein [Pseudomaricurvus alkylphenolicus]NIB39010.1 DUF917 domain-containing protein [Pseudomaricurvus alkylphenolicus]